MTRDQALAAVQARFPRIRAGHWNVNGTGDDGCVTHRYTGRVATTVEVFVTESGGLEDVDGNPYEGGIP